MRTFVCAALLLVGLLGEGCKKASKLVGKWSASADGGTATAEFRSNETFTMGFGIGPTVATWGGDYKFDGTTLTATTKEIDAPGVDAAILQKTKESLPKSAQRSKIVFVSDDEITMIGILSASPEGNNRAITLRRVE